MVLLKLFLGVDRVDKDAPDAYGRSPMDLIRSHPEFCVIFEARKMSSMSMVNSPTNDSEHHMSPRTSEGGRERGREGREGEGTRWN